MKKNENWLFFHCNLMGYNLYKNGEMLPKFIAFWRGFNSEEILTGNSQIIACKK